MSMQWHCSCTTIASCIYIKIFPYSGGGTTESEYNTDAHDAGSIAQQLPHPTLKPFQIKQNFKIKVI